MIRALLFDFNGVLVDDEPVHFQLFQKVLGEEGIPLTRENYYSRYLGMDDFDCFSAVAKDSGKNLSRDKIESMIKKKSSYYFQRMEKENWFIPGAVDFIRRAAPSYYLAVVSGALRTEIEALLQREKIFDSINSIVAAGEVKRGKPAPDGFIQAMLNLNRDYVASSELLLPQECLVFEDSTWGIDAAKAASMPCVALTTSYAEKELPGAQRYLKNFKGIDPQVFLKSVET